MVQTILPLLNTNKNKISKWISYFGLGIGVVLLLSSMQMFININSLLKENNPRKNGFDFISITKVITNENMGKNNTFKDNELAEIKSQPTVQDAAPLISNQYRVKGSAGTIVPFSTDLFLESIDNNFIDTVPPTFTWQPGQQTVPIIFSSDFLELYNVFAPSQDLPQLSAKTVSSVNIILEVYGAAGVQNFKGNIVALSDRINSILVPKTFMEWSNQTLGGVSKVNPSRIYIKTKDANDPQLISFLENKNYHLNKDKTKFGRIKKVLQNIVSALGVFGILVIVLALMLFSFYLQLMIAKSKENLQLLLTLGYSPNWLSKAVAKTWIPVYVFVVIASVVITALLHYAFVKISFVERNDLSYFLHWSVLVVGILLLLLSVFTNYRLVKKELYKIV
ncbi:MAG TPA: FtsX-like permease family protein [Chitinophagaceae bacterium]